ncbi:RUN domain protein [Dictyocaulus viviparus]|uniref:RUN domain protein n=1 Tax=Dictyocaulus viviparus TaxID=29172 RepID=A0A0D8XGY6_DICVI|nr:RUN domain protein [Dictyocaulus viviparus]
MLTNPNYEKSKVSIHDELETVLKAAESSNYSEKDGIPRDPFFIKGSRYAKYPEPNIWPFVSKYSEKSVIEEVNSQKQIRTEVGRGRAWIRIVMNKNSLEHYLRLLIRETKAISQFYDQQALLCDLERVEDISGLLKSLDALPIHAAVNSSFLNTWTPSPLILAGLVSGKPLKVGALKPRRRATSLCDNLEGVVGAKIDFLHSKHESTNRLLNSGKGKFTNVATSDDDNSSVYSHPSMLGSTDNIPEHVILASTPLQDIVGELPPQNIAVGNEQDPLIVSRRTRRSRRPRKAGEPNSVRAHSESECVSGFVKLVKR